MGNTQVVILKNEQLGLTVINEIFMRIIMRIIIYEN